MYERKQFTIKMKNISLLMCLLATFSLCACQENSSTNSSSNSSEDTNTSEVETANYNLRVDTTNAKVEYTTDESFTNDGLLVYLIKTIEGNRTEELTEEYQLYLDGIALYSGDELSLGSHEITVASTRTDITVRSTNYSINVVSPLVDRTLSEFIAWMLEEKNYQVETTIITPEGNAILNGTIVDNGVLWIEPTDDFDGYDFTSEGYGFSPYQGRTFVWKLDEEKEVLTDIFFIDNWINGNDQGWNNKSTRDRWGYRVNNGTIFTITNDELSYLKTLNPNEGQGSIYSIDVSHSEWLFTLIGYKDANWNPLSSFISGTLSIQVNSDGTMNISGQSTDDDSTIFPFTSKIYNVGKTTIPALENFLANPDFQGLDTRDPLLYFFEQIASDNYVIEANNKTSIHFTEKYIYGENGSYFIDDSSFALNAMTIAENNNRGLEAGIYPLIKENNDFTLGNEKYDDIYELRHLKNYREFKQENYFIKDGTTTYMWSLNKEEDAEYDPTFSLHFLLKWFIDPEFNVGTVNLGGAWSGVEIVKKVMLDVTKDTDYVITMYSDDAALGSFHINSFGNANILEADQLYNSFY